MHSSDIDRANVEAAIHEAARQVAAGVRLVLPEPNWEAIRLGKEATTAKSAGDWDRAIDCLRTLKAEHHEMSTRLPLFLCQAGRWEEAMIEFQELLDTALQRVSLKLSGAHISETKVKLFVAQERFAVHDKMRVAFKRGKKIEEAAHHEAEAAALDVEICRMRPIVDEEDRARLQAFRDEREQWRLAAAESRTKSGQQP